MPAVPHDRTSKQPLRGYCLNPECREVSTDSRYEFDLQDDHFACPKCKSTSPVMVGLLVLIHLLIRDQRGPIMGSEGVRYRFACDSGRVVLATPTNLEAATGDPSAANCPGCLKAKHDEKIDRIQGAKLVPREKQPAIT